jgi:WD40 repeat protein
MFTLDIAGNFNVWRGDEEALRRSSSFLGATFINTFGSSNRATHLKRLEGIGRIDAFDPHPTDGNRVIICRGGDIESWDFGFGFEPSVGWRRSIEGCRRAAWLPDGSAIVVGSDDGSVQCFSARDESVNHVLRARGAAVGDVAVSSDAAVVAVAAEDGSVVILAIADGRELARTEVGVPLSVEFGADDCVCIGTAAGGVLLWRWRTQQEPSRMATANAAVLGMAASGDGKVLYTVADDVAAWDLGERMQLWSSTDSGGRWQAALTSRPAVTADGRFVVVGCMDGSVRCLSTADGGCRSTTQIRSSVPMKPANVTAVGTSDDSRSAFVGLWDGTLVVIDLMIERELLRFSAHSKVITSVAQFPGTGEVLTSSLDPDDGGSNEFVRVWRLLDPSPLLVRSAKPTAVTLSISLPETAENADSAVSWGAALRAAFDAEYGHTPDEDRGSSHSFDLAEVSTAGRAAGPGNDDRPISALRVALRADPHSPACNLDLALACVAAGNVVAARDLIRRVLQFQGESLIVDPAAAYLAAEVLIEDDRVQSAVPFLVRAADHDNPLALLRLGTMSMTGEGTPRDERGGAEMFRRSAELGNADAAYCLGVYYEHVQPELSARTNWLAIAFGESHAVPSDSMRQAFDWYRRAAEGRSPAAQIRMGDFYAVGEIVDQDIGTAREWFERADVEGNALAGARLRALVDGPAPDEIR